MSKDRTNLKGYPDALTIFHEIFDEANPVELLVEPNDDYDTMNSTHDLSNSNYEPEMIICDPEDMSLSMGELKYERSSASITTNPITKNISDDGGAHDY